MGIRHLTNRTMLSAAAVLATAAALSLASCTGERPQPAASATSPSSTAGWPSTPSQPPTPTPTPPTSSSPSAPSSATPRPSATSPIPAGLRGKDVTVIPTTRKVVALTFDGGANADGVSSILATLRHEHISATFFVTGDFAADYPSAVRSIIADGHRIANHTATHPHLPALSRAQILDELRRAEAQIFAAASVTSETAAAAGADPRPLFRFPFGDTNSATINIINDVGYVPVRWTVDTLGWKGTSGGASAGLVTDRVVSAARPGEIVLMHVGSNPDDRSTLDADALPTVISRLRALGYTFVTLDALLTAA